MLALPGGGCPQGGMSPICRGSILPAQPLALECPELPQRSQDKTPDAGRCCGAVRLARGVNKAKKTLWFWCRFSCCSSPAAPPSLPALGSDRPPVPSPGVGRRNH